MKPIPALLLVLALVPRAVAHDYLATATAPRAIPAPKNAWLIDPPSGQRYCIESPLRPVVAKDPADGTTFVATNVRWISLGVIPPEG